MFVRTLHSGNDSDRTVPKTAERLAEHEARSVLRDRFGLAPNRLAGRLARLRDGGA
jgi:hypothetical protein